MPRFSGAEDALILVDPGIDGAELNELADDLDRLDIPVVAGFATGPFELIGLVRPLPADGEPVSGKIIEQRAHATGRAAVLLADRGDLLAGYMLSDVLNALIDPPLVRSTSSSTATVPLPRASDSDPQLGGFRLGFGGFKQVALLAGSVGERGQQVGELSGDLP